MLCSHKNVLSGRILRIENLKIISHSLHSSISNNRRRAKGYKLNLSDDERRRRSDFMKEMRKNNFKKATE